MSDYTLTNLIKAASGLLFILSISCYSGSFACIDILHSAQAAPKPSPGILMFLSRLSQSQSELHFASESPSPESVTRTTYNLYNTVARAHHSAEPGIVISSDDERSSPTQTAATEWDENPDEFIRFKSAPLSSPTYILPTRTIESFEQTSDLFLVTLYSEKYSENVQSTPSPTASSSFVRQVTNTDHSSTTTVAAASQSEPSESNTPSGAECATPDPVEVVRLGIEVLESQMAQLWDTHYKIVQSIDSACAGLEQCKTEFDQLAKKTDQIEEVVDTLSAMLEKSRLAREPYNLMLKSGIQCIARDHSFKVLDSGYTPGRQHFICKLYKENVKCRHTVIIYFSSETLEADLSRAIEQIKTHSAEEHAGREKDEEEEG